MYSIPAMNKMVIDFNNERSMDLCVVFLKVHPTTMYFARTHYYLVQYHRIFFLLYYLGFIRARAATIPIVNAILSCASFLDSAASFSTFSKRAVTVTPPSFSPTAGVSEAIESAMSGLEPLLYRIAVFLASNFSYSYIYIYIYILTLTLTEKREKKKEKN